VNEIFCSETDPNTFVYNWASPSGISGYDTLTFNNHGQITFYETSGDYINCAVGENYQSTYLSLWNAYPAGISTLTAAATAWDAQFAPNGVLIYNGVSYTTSATRISAFESLITNFPGDTTIQETFCSNSNANSFAYRWTIPNGEIGIDDFIFNAQGQVIYYLTV